jgi:hypothetical protein
VTTTFSVPGVATTQLLGLNNKYELVGYYIDAAGNFHGMIITVTP